MGSRDRIRILYFVNTTVRAGVEEHVLSLVERLDRNEFDISLACPEELISSMEDELRRTGARLLPVRISGWRQVDRVRRLLGFMKKERIDIVHSHMFISTFFAAPIARMAGVPVVVDTSHGREAWRRSRLGRSFVVDRFIARFVDRVIAVSEDTARYLVNEKGISADKVTVIHNGRDLSRFDPVRSANGLRKSLGIAKEDITITVVGRLEPQKGHRYFFEALPPLMERHPNVKALIVGDGSLEGELKEQCSRLGISDRVVFTGFLNDVPEVLSLSDVVVLPSLYEGLPLTAIEASAMARPVIATAVDGTPEVIMDGRTGILVRPKDPEGLRDAMFRLVTDEATRRSYGDMGRRTVTERFSLDRQVKRTAMLYRELMDGKRLGT